MKQINFRDLLIVAAISALVSILGLWSWNTLASLFDGPQAQYRHVLAAATALLILRWSFTGSHFHRMRPGRSRRLLDDSGCDQRGDNSPASVKS